MPKGTEPIVRFENICKRYPGAPVPALAVKSFAIAKGEFFSILGPSGSGKTTALRLIAGFERPDEGRIWVGDRDVTDVPPHKRDVNTVFQSYALFPHMTVRENVEYPVRMAGGAKAERGRRAAEALALVEMTNFADRYPHQMSGGQRQRVALARAFVGRPKVLLLDEPLSALDLTLRQQMQHVLVELQRELDLTFVYVTHDQGEALSMSNRVAVIDGGVIQQLDVPNAIYYQPSNRFVAQFIGKSNVVPIRVSQEQNGQTGSFEGQVFRLTRPARAGESQLSIRFEALAITPDGAAVPHPVQLPGRVSDVLFLGNSCEVRVRCGDRDLIGLIPARRDAILHPDQDVIVSFDPADCVVVDG